MDVPVPDDTSHRLHRLEWNQEQQGERLNAGAEAFSDVRQSISSMTDDIHKMSKDIQAAAAPKALPWKWLAVFGFTILCAFAGGVWTIARYPDRTEFVEVQKANHASHVSMEASLVEVEKAQALMVTSQDDSTAALGEIDTKLGKLLGDE